MAIQVAWKLCGPGREETFGCLLLALTFTPRSPRPPALQGIRASQAVESGACWGSM